MENLSEFESSEDIARKSENSSSQMQEDESAVSEGYNSGEDGNGASGKSKDDFPAQELLGVKDLMKISWKMLAERIKKLCAAVILYLLLFIAACMLVVVVYAISQNQVLTLIFGVLSVVFILIIVFVYNIVIMEIMGDKGIGIKDAIKKSFPKIVPYTKCMLAFIALFFDLLLPFVISGAVYAAAVAMLSAMANSQMAQSSINILSWMMGIFIFAYIIFFFLASLLMSAWQSFAFFSTVLDGRPAGEGVAYAYGMVKRRKKSMIWRISAFLILYFAITIVLNGVSKDNLIMSLISQIINLIMGLWMYTYFYAMYKNVRAMHGIEVDSRDIEIVKKFVKTGIAGIVLAIIAGGAMLAYIYSGFMDKSGAHMENQNNVVSVIELRHESSNGILNV